MIKNNKINSENVINFFNEKSITWDLINKDAAHGANKICTIFKEQIQNKKILDIGCGTGVLTKFLLNLNAKEIWGIDISPKMIEIAKKKFSENKICHFICEDILSYNSKNKFDTIIIYNAYPHLPHTQALVNKINFLLNENGLLIIAHGAGKEKINSHHNKCATKISTTLNSTESESKLWNSDFVIQKQKDDKEIYYFSLSKK